MKPSSRFRRLYRWAFPRGSHHQLLRAAIGRDADAGRDAAHRWLSENNIDDATFRDQRLLLAIIGRFGDGLSGHRAYPRLLGLQRLLWSRSLLALQEAKPTLRKIVCSGHPLLLIKGAARLAADPAARKQRVAWDIDAVVRPESMGAAFDALVGDRWQPSPGTSHHYLRHHLRTLRAVNFYKGRFGDIDLHSQAFLPGQGGLQDDQELWDRSVPATLDGLQVQVPCSEDRIALAIAHGGADGHAHSDWFVDCAAVMQAEQVDWAVLRKTLARRRVLVPANVMFRYFTEQLDWDIPPAFVEELSDAAARTASMEACLGLIQARPKEQFGSAGQVVRGLAKMIRKRAALHHTTRPPADRTLNVQRLVAAAAKDACGEFVKSFELPLSPQVCQAGEMDVQMVVDIEPFAGRRRVELEINAADTHVCRIRYRRLLSGSGPVRLKISGQVRAASAKPPLTLVSRPSRQLRPQATSQQHTRYDSLAFRVVSCEIRGLPQQRAA